MKLKHLLFSLTPAVGLILFLALTEFGLRLFSPSLTVPLVRPLTIDGVEYVQINKDYLGRYFPASSANVPEFKTALVKKHKPAGMLRVICLGESSMLGTPYVMTATIPAVVRKQLRHLYPGREIEVLNLGAAAINTNVIRHLSDAVLNLQPDVVLLYAGHNEFYGPDGVGASFLERQFPPVTQWKYSLRDLRLVRAFQYLLASISSKPDQRNAGMMEELSRGAQVRLNAPPADRTFRHFDENLRSIIGTFQGRNIPVVISTVTSNLMFPPFVSDSLPEAPDLKALFERNDHSTLNELLDASLRRDSTNALALYWKGRLELAHGDTASCRTFLARARDLDLLKFRAPKEINVIIRRVCATTHAALIDADSTFASQSPGRIPAYNLFSEHLHPTAEGYALIGDLYTQAIRRLDVAPLQDIQPSALPLLPFDPDSLSICWLDLVYGELAVNSMTRKWPFHGTGTPTPLFDHASADLRQIVIRVINRGGAWDEGCYQSAARFVATGETRKAVTTYDALIEEFWFNAAARQLKADLLRDAGDYTGAAEEYERSLVMHPDNPEARISLGFIFINSGSFGPAIKELQAALASPSTAGNSGRIARASYGLAAAFANKKDFVPAEKYLAESLRADPSFAPALSLMEELRKYGRVH